ncbi:MAG: hypothetical protein AAGH90_10325 [Pseudomonadota bacterium]
MIKNSLFVIGAVAFLSAPAFASGLQATQIVEVADIKIDADGNEVKTFISSSEIAPGDEVRYRLVYDNQGDSDALDVNLVMPVPVEINFIEGSATSQEASVVYSVDDGVSFADRGDLRILIDGEDRIATSEEITHIKWTFTEAIEAGDTGEISFRGVLQ